MRFLLLSVIIVVTIFSPLFAAPSKDTVHTMTIKDLVGIKNIINIDISPSGTQIACTVSEADFKKSRYISHIYAVIRGKAALFASSSEGEEHPRWSPDGRYLAFISSRDFEGDKEKQIWLIPSTGGEARRITDEGKGVKEFAWCSGGTSMLYLAREPLPAAALQYREKQKKNRLDGKVRDKGRLPLSLNRVDIESGEVVTLHQAGPGAEGLSLSPDGKYAAYTSNGTGDPDDEARRNVFLFSLADGKLLQLTRDMGVHSKICWSKDGKKIAYLQYSEPPIEFSRADILLTDISTGRTENLTGKHDMEVLDLCWPPDSRGIYFRAARATATPIFVIDIETGKLARITGDDGHYSRFAVSSDGRTIACARESSREAPELFLITGEGTLKELSSFNSRIKKKTLVPQEVITWKSTDGRSIEGVLVKPLTYEAGRLYPLIVIVHGGPYSRVVNTLSDREFQPLASEGYMVLAPNYRGSCGYGKEFAMATRGHLMEKDYQDVMSGVDYLIDSKGADPGRLGITGGSYGGYMTNWALSQTDRFKAGVSLYGIFSLIGDMSNSIFPSFEKDYVGVWYWENLEPYMKSSPFVHAGSIHTPMLILHGDDDENTFPSNSLELYTALKKQGKTVEFIQYPREGHGFEEPNHLIDAYERTLQWFDRYLDNKAAYYRLGSEIASGGKILQVVSVSSVDDYAGMTSKDRLLEISALITMRDSLKSGGTMEFSLPGDIYVLTGDSVSHHPIGIPADLMGERVLIRARDQVYTLKRKKDESELSLPVAATFEIPRHISSLRLVVKGFPPLRIRVPGDSEK